MVADRRSATRVIPERRAGQLLICPTTMPGSSTSRNSSSGQHRQHRPSRRRRIQRSRGVAAQQQRQHGGGEGDDQWICHIEAAHSRRPVPARPPACRWSAACRDPLDHARIASSTSEKANSPKPITIAVSTSACGRAFATSPSTGPWRLRAPGAVAQQAGRRRRSAGWRVRDQRRARTGRSRLPLSIR